VTEKRLVQHAGGSSFVVRKFNNLLFATVLKLGSNVAMLPSDVVPSHETIAQKHWSEVDALRQSTMRCRTRNDMSRAHETADSANMGQKRRRQEDGRAVDAGKKSKAQDRKDVIRKRLKTMTADDTATFVDHLFSTIQILCGLIHQSRAAVVRSSVEPTVAGFGSEVAMIDLTSMMNDDDITPAADDFEHLPAPARTSRFYPQDLELPSGATVQIPNNYCNKLFTVSDVARYRKERKIVAALDKVLSRERCQPTPISQRLHAGYASSHPTVSPDSQALLIGMAMHSHQTVLLPSMGERMLTMDRPKMQLMVTTTDQRNMCEAIAAASRKHSLWKRLPQKLQQNWQRLP
jgi:hypothetical protein